MVKIVRAAAGPEIVTIRDLTGARAASSAGPLHEVSSAVENFDRWISLADRGISMLGRVDSIVSRVQSIRGSPPGPQQQQAPPVRYVQDPGTPINKDLIAAAPETVVIMPGEAPGPAAAPPQLQQPPPIDLNTIINVLGMVDGMQPGITVRELQESIQRKPVAVARMMQLYMTGNLKDVTK